MYWHGGNKHITLLHRGVQKKKNTFPSNAYFPDLSNSYFTGQKASHGDTTLRMEVTCCDWSHISATMTASASGKLMSHAVVVAHARTKAGKDTQARTVECTHSSSIRKAPTDMRVLHLTHTHASSPLSSWLLFRQSRHNSPQAALQVLPPYDICFCTSFLRWQTSLILCVSVFCIWSACIVFLCDKVGKHWSWFFPYPAFKHASVPVILCQAMAQPILRWGSFKPRKHTNMSAGTFKTQVHLLNARVILPKSFSPNGLDGQTDGMPTVPTVFMTHLLKKLSLESL